MQNKRLIPIRVYLTEEAAAWLDAKVKEGYKKASLVRYVLEKHISGEVGA